MTLVRLATVLVATATTGCAPALREPPPVASLAGPAAPTAGSAAGAGDTERGPDKERAAALLAQASVAFAARPDTAQIRRAEALFIEAATADPNGTDGLVGAIQVKGWLVQHEKDASVRTSLAESAVQAGQWCDRRAPGRAECDYGLAVGLGMQARERPSTASDALKLMVERLRRAQKSNPKLDQAGPHRVLALLLLRAPGWPAGPGDPDGALVEAQRAVELSPEHAPNLLVLAEAHKATGDQEAARRTTERALELARAAAAGGDRDAPDWIAEGEALMSALR